MIYNISFKTSLLAALRLFDHLFVFCTVIISDGLVSGNTVLTVVNSWGWEEGVCINLNCELALKN